MISLKNKKNFNLKKSKTYFLKFVFLSLFLFLKKVIFLMVFKIKSILEKTLKKIFSIKKLFKSTQFALNGLKIVYKNEVAFRQECFILFFSILITFFINVSKVEKILMIGSIVFILIIEIINTAIEKVVNRIGTEKNILSGEAKDISASAVFVSILLAFFIWFIILF
ncbi:diacylglycerol kinase [Candidatus Hamiltonella endosymbiont of Tuberolachnus salignus]